MDNEGQISRATEREILGRLDPGPAGTGHPSAFVVATVDEGAYPTASPGVFACEIQTVSFDEDEGAAISGPSGTGSRIYVYNVTNIIPPIGAVWIAVPGDGARWYMEYNGPPKS